MRSGVEFTLSPYFLKNKCDRHHLIDLGNNLVIPFQSNLVYAYIVILIIYLW